jgi:hypothetical protein
MDEQKEFSEWMVTKSLAKYLGYLDATKSSTPHADRVSWLFGLDAQTPSGKRSPISKLCGFPRGEGVDGGPEKSLVSTDRNDIPAEELKLFRSLFADFGFWTSSRDMQLIVEAKGTPKPVGERDRIQARHYFEYLWRYPRRGALVYLVPEPASWLEWLNKLAGDTQLVPTDDKTWGVVGWAQIIPQIAGYLARTLSDSLAETAQLMDKASRFLIQNDV